MADTYGALTGKPGVCLATLGPGAINLMLGVANAQLDSHPLVAITAQAGLDRVYKESHQFVDLVSLFRPITKWGDMVTVRVAAPEMVRKAFKRATTERPGRHVPRAARGRRRAPHRRARAPREHAGRSGSRRGPGASSRPRARRREASRGARGTGRGSGRSHRGADPVQRTAQRAGGDDLPGQGGVPRQPPERARHDRVHGQGLRELRVRPSRRGRGGRLRPRGVLARPLESARSTSRSCTCTAPWPRSTRTTPSPWGWWAASPRRSMPSAPRAPCTTSVARSSPCAISCGRSSSGAPPTTPSRWRRPAWSPTSARCSMTTTSCCATRAR